MNNPVLIYALLGAVILLVIVVFYQNKKKDNSNTSSVAPIAPQKEGVDKNLLDQFYGEIHTLKQEKEALKNKLVELENSKSLYASDTGDSGNKEILDKLVAVQKEKESLLDKCRSIEEDYKNKLHQLQEQTNTSNNDAESSQAIILRNETLEKELKKLQKEIEDSEEEIDVLEDEIKDLKVKLQKEKDEVEELSNKVRTLKKETEELQSENEILADDLKSEKEKLVSKNNSLGFINEILDAQTNNKEEENDNLKSLRNYIYYEVLDLFQLYYNEDVIYELSKQLWHWANIEQKIWLKEKKVIAIVGEFSAGKTSLVNRILSQDDPKAVLLPVSSKETTAIPTYISNGVDFNCRFYSPNYGLSNIKKETFENVTKSILDDVKISSLIEYFVVSYKNKNLENISILDTPGFASNSSELLKRTTDVVRESDAVFWVVDANTGDLNQTSIKVMKEHLHDIPLYLIINKCDTKSPSDLKLLEEKIQKTLNNNAIKVTSIIHFSKNAEVSHLLNVIKIIEPKEHFNLIEEVRDGFKGISELLQEEYELNRENNNIVKENINLYEKDFKVMNSNINYYLEEVSSCVNYKEVFFGSDHYRIEKETYGYFTQSMERLSETGHSINQYIPKFKEEVEDSVKIGIDLNDSKYALNRLESIEKRFNELVKNYK
ncbi:hypothetical protein HMPREF9714_02403 [Myroides odoratimimus CCUG 12901]|uniref:dynamin family protein n=1 Tax=Myroides odoratimimus TaxID=76832 RepID=UPI000245F900|nr:dynamin family protein [Myroides odoratimimus]EHO07805.1 hypothetical protein HMPREF9714_02403 [Myroides odoratimimus CCUG 12901]